MMFDDQPSFIRARSQFIQDSCSWSIVTSALIKQFGLLQVLLSQKLSLLHQIFSGSGVYIPAWEGQFLALFLFIFCRKIRQKDSSKKFVKKFAKKFVKKFVKKFRNLKEHRETLSNKGQWGPFW